MSKSKENLEVKRSVGRSRRRFRPKVDGGSALGEGLANPQFSPESLAGEHAADPDHNIEG